MLARASVARAASAAAAAGRRGMATGKEVKFGAEVSGFARGGADESSAPERLRGGATAQIGRPCTRCPPPPSAPSTALLA